MSWLENIQNKSPEQKRKIIYTILASITILLFLLWFLTAQYKKRNPEGSLIIQNFKDIIKDVSPNLNTIKQSK